jgi:hypothetical protein
VKCGLGGEVLGYLQSAALQVGLSSRSMWRHAGLVKPGPNQHDGAEQREREDNKRFLPGPRLPAPSRKFGRHHNLRYSQPMRTLKFG